MSLSQPAFAIGLEASTEAASVAVWVPDGRIETSVLQGHREHALRFLPELNTCLQALGVENNPAGVIGVDTGPGSFTGLRTVCAIAQGLSLGWNVGCALFSSLELMAIEVYLSMVLPVSTVLCVMDARLGQVYWAMYDLQNDAVALTHGQVCAVFDEPASHKPLPRCQEIVPPRLSSPQALWEDPAWLECQAVATCAVNRPVDGPVGLTAKNPDIPWLPVVPSAKLIARLAWRRHQEGRLVDAAFCQPVYLRDKVAQTTAERIKLRQDNLANGLANRTVVKHHG